MLIPRNAIDRTDFNAYYANCFLIDPNTNQPAVLIEVQHGETAEWPHVFFTENFVGDSYNKLKHETKRYEGPATEKFYDTSIYSNFPLGYRSIDQGRQLFYFHNSPARLGQRGLNFRRIGVDIDRTTQFGFGHLVKMHIEFQERRAAWLILKPEFIGIKDGIEMMARGERASIALCPEAALVLSTSKDAKEFPISVLYKQRLLAKASLDGNVVSESPSNLDLLNKALAHVQAR
jgi:hypothetical protein